MSLPTYPLWNGKDSVGMGAVGFDWAFWLGAVGFDWSFWLGGIWLARVVEITHIQLSNSWQSLTFAQGESLPPSPPSKPCPSLRSTPPPLPPVSIRSSCWRYNRQAIAAEKLIERWISSERGRRRLFLPVGDFKLPLLFPSLLLLLLLLQSVLTVRAKAFTRAPNLLPKWAQIIAGNDTPFWLCDSTRRLVNVAHCWQPSVHVVVLLFVVVVLVVVVVMAMLLSTDDNCCRCRQYCSNRSNSGSQSIVTTPTSPASTPTHPFSWLSPSWSWWWWIVLLTSCTCRTR